MSKERPTPSAWLEHGSYVLIAVAAVLGALVEPGHVVGDGVDLYGTFWFFWWIADCLANARDPSFTNLMFHPLGKDIFAHTGNNFIDALVAAPLVRLLGFPRYQPVFVALVLWGNAVSFRPLACRVLGRGPGAWAATLLWQTAPFTLFELMTGRVTQAFLWFLPLGVHWFLQIGEVPTAGRGLRRLWQQTRAPVLAGLFTALQAATYWFMGYFMAVAFAWLAAVAMMRSKGARVRLVWGWGLAGAVCGLCILPALLAMAGAAEAGAVPGLPSDGGLLAKPTAVGNNVAATLHGYWLMETHGQPLFSTLFWGAALCAGAVVGRDRLRWTGLSLVALFFALGPTLPVGGSPGDPAWSWPYLVAYNGLPFLDRLWFPYRLAVIAFLGAALSAGSVVDRLDELVRRVLPRLPVLVVPVALVTGHLVEQNRHLAFPLLHRELQAPAVYEVIAAEEGALIELPIGLARVSIAWQAVHGQPTFGGMAENAPVFWPPGFKQRFRNTFIKRLRQATRAPTEQREHRARDLERLRAEGFRWVVLDRQLVDADIHRWPWARDADPADVGRAAFLSQERVIEALGAPTMADGPLLVWDLDGGVLVPDALRPTEEALRSRSWSRDEMPEYERHLREIGRLPAP